MRSVSKAVATRAFGATVVAAYSPRVRPGTPVSFPVSWADLAQLRPADFTIKTAAGLVRGRDAWADSFPRRGDCRATSSPRTRDPGGERQHEGPPATTAVAGSTAAAAM